VKNRAGGKGILGSFFHAAFTDQNNLKTEVASSVRPQEGFHQAVRTLVGRLNSRGYPKTARLLAVLGLGPVSELLTVPFGEIATALSAIAAQVVLWLHSIGRIEVKARTVAALEKLAAASPIDLPLMSREGEAALRQRTGHFDSLLEIRRRIQSAA
jgi:hypothetical protein